MSGIKFHVSRDTGKRDTEIIATLCSSARTIAHAVLLQGFFGGKERMGDGAPKGLPLNCRFFQFDG